MRLVVAEEVAVPREKKRMMDAYIHACMTIDAILTMMAYLMKEKEPPPTHGTNYYPDNDGNKRDLLDAYLFIRLRGYTHTIFMVSFEKKN
jgi:hypothetical protein